MRSEGSDFQGLALNLAHKILNDELKEHVDHSASARRGRPIFTSLLGAWIWWIKLDGASELQQQTQSGAEISERWYGHCG